jgi:hypothetical protein
MRKHKGSWIVNVKDTYHLGEINSAVLAHIQKLYDTIKDRECIGIPMYYVDKQAELQGVDHDHRPDDVDLDAAHQLRLRDLEELLWTYTDNEPDIADYDFHEITCTNDEERDRYTKDIDKYWERITAGYELAGKIWRELQW